MNRIKLSFKNMAMALMCASAFSLVGCISVSTASQPSKKQAATTTYSSTSRTSTQSSTNATATPAATTIDGNAKADGSTSKGRKVAGK
ncbi:MAG: hypothetical protein MJZ27_10280 [Bacteroidales bacterium]|nr:hypothetical protein [Bacteroidales bacterium]